MRPTVSRAFVQSVQRPAASPARALSEKLPPLVQCAKSYLGIPTTRSSRFREQIQRQNHPPRRVANQETSVFLANWLGPQLETARPAATDADVNRGPPYCSFSTGLDKNRAQPRSSGSNP